MSYTSNNRIICDECGLFTGNDADEWTPFGCSDPEAPEPYEPSHLCKKCSKEIYKKKLAYFNEGDRTGDWQKSNAEIRAAKKAGLEWIHSSGIIDTRNYKDISYQYIKKSEREHYVPYLEFMKNPKNREKYKKAEKERQEKFISEIPF